MNRTFSAILLALVLSACGTETDPSEGDSILGTEDTDTTGDESDESDSTDTTDSDGTGETDTDGDTTDTGDTDTGVDPNPTLGESCNPILAFMGIAPCEWTPENQPDNDSLQLTCVVETPQPTCVLLTHWQGSESDIGDYCNSMDSCLNSRCVIKYQDPQQQNLPDSFCPDEINPPTACCSMFCTQSSDCGDPNVWNCYVFGDPNLGDLGVCGAADLMG